MCDVRGVAGGHVHAGAAGWVSVRAPARTGLHRSPTVGVFDLMCRLAMSCVGLSCAVPARLVGMYFGSLHGTTCCWDLKGIHF